MGAGAVKNFSVPGFTLKTDMSAGEAAKTKETEAMSAKAAGDGFEAAKAGNAEAPMEAAADIPPGLQQALDTLRDVLSQAREEVNSWPWYNPAKYAARFAINRAENILDTVEELIRSGAEIGQGVVDTVNAIIQQLRGLLG